MDNLNKKKITVHDLLVGYQTGTPVQSSDEQNITGIEQKNEATGSFLKPMTLEEKAQFALNNGSSIQDYTEEAVQRGFGKSRYDSAYTPGMDIEDARARAQSGLAKIGLGLTKGTITAGATFLNSTIGLLSGVVAGAADLAFDPDDNGRSLGKAVDAGVNNAFSNEMLKLQRWSEEQFPNYRTDEERTDKYQKEWYKHIFTGNFIGDSILKNFGFTVGAMGAGALWARGLSSIMAARMSNDILRGSVAASAGDDAAIAAMNRASEALKRGTAMRVGGEELEMLSAQAAKRINSAPIKLQLFGSIISAMGEGSTEGTMARDEYMTEYNEDWNRRFSKEYDSLEEEILKSGDSRYVNKRVYQNYDGSFSTVHTLTESGKAYLKQKQEVVAAKYQREKAFVNEEADRLATTTYLLNLPILTTSNFIQFGRMFSGGWKTAKLNQVKTKGGISVTGANVTSNFAKKGNKWLKAAKGAAKVGYLEGQEEMLQGTASSGAKRVLDSKLSSFNDTGFDEEATMSARDWFMSMAEGGAEYLKDPKNWQEGFVGALTGLFGIPGKRWNGGIIGEYKEAKEEETKSKTAADALNQYVHNPEFQKRWQDYIRHLKYDNDLKKAIAQNDQYAWHTADDNQLISDVIMFAKNGRINDLLEFVDTYTNTQLSDVEGMRQMMIQDKTDIADWAKTASAQELTEKVKKQADKIRTAIADYKTAYTNIASRTDHELSENFLQEIIATSMQIKAYERRFFSLFDEVMTGVDSMFNTIQLADDEGNVITDKAKKLEEIKRLTSEFERLLTRANENTPIVFPAVLNDYIHARLDELDKNTANYDKALNEKVNDLIKIADARSEFYRKLTTLTENKVNEETGETAEEEFNNSAQTQEKKEIKLEQKFVNESTKGLTDFEKVRQEFLPKTYKERNAYIDTLRKAKQTKGIKEFLAFYDKYMGFYKYAMSHLDEYTYKYGILPNMLSGLVKDVLNNAKSIDEIYKLDDNLFESKEEFDAAYKNPLGFYNEKAYDNTKQVIRELMEQFAGADKATSTRGKIQQTDIAQTPKEGEPVAGSPDNNPIIPGMVIVPSRKKTGKGADKKSEEFSKKNGTEPSTVPAETPTPETGALSPIDEQKIDEAVRQNSTNPDVVSETKDAESDASTARRKEEKEALDYSEYEAGKRIGINTSVPEISPLDAREARDRRSLTNTREEGLFYPLPDFNIANPEYDPTYTALKNAGAFAYISNKLKVGDEIHFLIDPQFPKYNGEPQIIMAAKKSDGTWQYLNILTLQERKFLGLGPLRSAILDEYDKFKTAKSNGVFEFSKTTKVWYKRRGLVAYIKGENALRDIGYDKDAPILFIDRDNKIQSINGISSKESNALKEIIQRKVGEELKAYQKSIKYVGRMYYGISDGAKGVIPLSLRVKPLSKSILNKTDSSIIAQIKTSTEVVVGIIKQANEELVKNEELPDTITTEHTDISFEVDEKTGKPISVPKQTTTKIKNPDKKDRQELIEQWSKTMHEALSNLRAVVDFKDIFFKIADFDNIGFALQINQVREKTAAEKEKNSGEKEMDNYVLLSSKLRTPDQLTSTWLLSYLTQSLKRPIDLRLPPSVKSKVIQTSNTIIEVTKQRIKTLIDEGLITTNVETLHAKGADFFISSWDYKTGDFFTTEKQQALLDAAERERKEEKQEEVLEEQVKEKSELTSTEKSSTVQTETKEEPLNLDFNIEIEDVFKKTIPFNLETELKKFDHLNDKTEFKKYAESWLRTGSNYAREAYVKQGIRDGIVNMIRESGIEVKFVNFIFLERLARENGKDIDSIRRYKEYSDLDKPRVTVYGAAKGNTIYLDEYYVRPETAIHEYTHLWDALCRKANPELWKRGAELLKKTKLWTKVSNDPFYKNMSENALLSEVHSQLTGSVFGIERLQRLRWGADNDKEESLIRKVEKWIKDFWEWVKSTFAKGDKLSRMSIDDFIDMPLVDLSEGLNLTDVEYFQQKHQRAREDSLFYQRVEKFWKMALKTNKDAFISWDVTTYIWDELPPNVKEAVTEEEWNKMDRFDRKHFLDCYV